MEEKPYICIDFLSKNVKKMKKIIMMTLMLVCGMTAVMAQKPAQIKFDKTTHNFGSFSENEPKVSCSFTFTNIGEQPLVINQAIASCGCTVPEYTKTPIQPGEKGEIKVTYNGKESTARGQCFLFRNYNSDLKNCIP